MAGSYIGIYKHSTVVTPATGTGTATALAVVACLIPWAIRGGGGSSVLQKKRPTNEGHRGAQRAEDVVREGGVGEGLFTREKYLAHAALTNDSQVWMVEYEGDRAGEY
ncbi:hypothetical protein V499_07476 [Pseudogymnoascus sp. VKM F-103]|nr:hypothetical protein V499_07476 [Pseudogymnoascus sp. VKM F-103]